MSDNANLLDVNKSSEVGQFEHHIVDESAVLG